MVKVDSTSSAPRGSWKWKHCTCTAGTPERHSSASAGKCAHHSCKLEVAHKCSRAQAVQIWAAKVARGARGSLARSKQLVLYTRRAQAVRGGPAAARRLTDARQRARRPRETAAASAPHAPTLPPPRAQRAAPGVHAKAAHHDGRRWPAKGARRCGWFLGAVSCATSATFHTKLKLTAQALPFPSQAAPRAARTVCVPLAERAAALRRVAAFSCTPARRKPWRCGNMARLSRASCPLETRAALAGRAWQVTGFGARRARE